MVNIECFLYLTYLDLKSQVSFSDNFDPPVCLSVNILGMDLFRTIGKCQQRIFGQREFMFVETKNLAFFQGAIIHYFQ